MVTSRHMLCARDKPPRLRLYDPENRVPVEIVQDGNYAKVVVRTMTTSMPRYMGFQCQEQT